MKETNFVVLIDEFNGETKTNVEHPLLTNASKEPGDRVRVDTKHVSIEGSSQLGSRADDDGEGEGGFPAELISDATTEEATNKQAEDVTELNCAKWRLLKNISEDERNH